MNVDAIIHHAGWVLFVWVFVNQSGVPVPVVPSLVAAGALAGRGGSSCAVMLAAAAGAALVADMVWYSIGRWHGAQVLSLLGRVLHRPRVWVDHIEHAFHAHEVGFQLWAQFLPQLNPIAARSEEHTSELQSRPHLVCRLLLEKKKNMKQLQYAVIIRF